MAGRGYSAESIGRNLERWPRMKDTAPAIGRGLYRFVVCGLVGFAVALLSALIAAVVAAVFLGGIQAALDFDSPGMPSTLLAYSGAAAAATLAGLVCGLVCVMTPHPSFRRALLRVVSPGCSLSAVGGATCGLLAGSLFDRRHPVDET